MAMGCFGFAPSQDAPPGARPMQLRMFYIPDETAEER
jgi:hypothetical protein